MEDRIGGYEIKPFSKYRKNVALIAHEGWRRHSLNALLQVDITEARKRIRNMKKNGKDVSFTAWIIRCLAEALKENKELNAYRLGRNKIAVFNDVDVAIPVEKRIDDENVPMAHIVRRANEKSIEDITKEIRDVQRKEAKSNQVLIEDLSLLERFVLRAPTFIKKIILVFSRRKGLLKKKHLGTVGVTSLGMFSKFSGWIIPLGGVNALLVVVNGTVKKPGVVGDEIDIREFLHLVVSFDHDLVDGATISRFLSRFTELLEKGFDLDA